MDGENARAIIRTKTTAKEIRVGIGDDVGGWKVSQIEGQRLVLSLDGRLATFVLFSGNTANGVPRPDVVPQPADKVPQPTDKVPPSADKKQQIQQNPPTPAPSRRRRQASSGN
jgi:hypothetical protein